MSQHHPEPDLLLDYATGSLGEAVSLVVACHLEACSDCRGAVARYESIGGSLLETLPPAEIEPEALAATLARIDALPADAAPAQPIAGASDRLPETLRFHVGKPIDSLRWRRIGPIETARLDVGRGRHRARLMRMAGGRAVPAHAHGGMEYTAVLSGGYTDRGEQFGPGDFAVSAPDEAHRPVIDPGEPCVALVVTEAPIRFTGFLTRLLNPLVS